jgi:anti-sigma B factor antagonist
MAIARALEIEEFVEAGGARLALRGELDIATVPQLQEAVAAALERSPGELTIDLRTLSFLDSSGLRQFILLAERAEQEGWRLALVRPGPPALLVFQITRAEENLPFVDEPPR